MCTVNISTLKRGEIWRVGLPNSSYQRFLVWQTFDVDEAGPMAVARAIPVTRFVRLACAGDAFIEVATEECLYVAHAWLMGPVSASRFVERVDEISENSIKAVSRSINVSAFSANTDIQLFRDSLIDETSPVFDDCWRELYEALG